MSLALGLTFLILASASFALASASLALVVSLASEGGLVPLPLPLSLAPSAPWPLSSAWLGPFEALGRGRVAWAVRGCSEVFGARVGGEGMAPGTL